MLSGYCRFLVIVALALSPARALAGSPPSGNSPEFFAGYEAADDPPPRGPTTRTPDAPAQAPRESRPTHFTTRPLALLGMVGFGTPVGLAGTVLEYSFVDELALGVGIGAGAASTEGGVILIMRPAHLEGPRAAHALAATLAWSTGKWRSLDLGDGNVHPGNPTADFANWIQADFGYEIRTRGGFSLRAAWGAALMLNRGDVRCSLGGAAVACALDNGPPLAMLTFTISIGYAFGI